MNGKERKGSPTTPARTDFLPRPAEALGHGKWQYDGEDVVLELIDRFFMRGPSTACPISARRWRAPNPSYVVASSTHSGCPSQAIRTRLKYVKALLSSVFTSPRPSELGR
jgi:hypothetical protein